MAIRADCQQPTHEQLEGFAQYIRHRTAVRPTLGVICGTGLGGLAKQLEEADTIHYKDIPNFPQCTVPGHAGTLVFGTLSGKPTVCMNGRLHFYEGHTPPNITLPVRVMKQLGVETLLVTNAAGGLNDEYNIGDIVIIRDHINLVGMTGFNPSIGEERFGSRHTAMNRAYDADLCALVRSTAEELGMKGFLREGVYVYLSGPSYETPAEARLLSMLGADIVGMSTAPEVIVARQCGMRVLGLSLVTNKVIKSYDSDIPPPTHEEVIASGKAREVDMQHLVKEIVKKL